jgi:hypothetical protein
MKTSVFPNKLSVFLLFFVTLLQQFKVYLEKQMSSLEEKLHDKLDKILICISKMDNTHPP